MPKQKVTLSIDREIYKKYKQWCEDNAIMLSKKIELFMQDELEKAEKFKKIKTKSKESKE